MHDLGQLERGCDLVGGLYHRARCDQANRRLPLAADTRPSRHVAQIRLPDPQVGWAALDLQRAREAPLQIAPITWGEDRDARQAPQEGDVLTGVVTGPEVRVDQARAVAEQHDRQALVAEIQLDLLDNPARHERGQSVDDDLVALARQAGRHADHVLLGDAAVEELARVLPPETVEQRVTVIARQHHQVRVHFGGFAQEARQRVLHTSLRSDKSLTRSSLSSRFRK